MVRHSRAIAKVLNKFYEAQGREFPWRSPDRSAWELLLAEVLLRVTIATKVPAVWENLVMAYPRPELLAKEEVDALATMLEPLGLQHQRADELVRLADVVHEQCGDEIPRTEEELLKLPGIGPYSARAFLLAVGGPSAPPVDRNVVRVVSRVLGLDGPDDDLVEDVWETLLKDSPDPQGTFFGALDLSAALCRPVKPRCPDCPLAAYCETGRERADIEATA